MKHITVAYLRTSTLDLCYSDARLQSLIDRLKTETPVQVLLSISRADAIRLICGLFTAEQRVDFAQFAARRAKPYAAAADAARAARAAYAAYAARAAAAYAYADADVAADAATMAAAAAADADADRQISIRYGAMLLGLGVA